MRTVFFKFISILFFLFLFCTCSDENKVKFGDYPANYKIAFFDSLGVKNIPSLNDLFGKNSSYAEEFMGVPAYIVIESYESTKEYFSVNILLKVEETEYDIIWFFFKFEADYDKEKTYVRHVKVESLLSGQFLEVDSDGSDEQDDKAFSLFIRYMSYIWK